MNSPPTSLLNLLVALNPSESDHFFNKRPEKSLETLGIPYQIIVADQTEPFLKALLEERPALVLGGWDMPALPLKAIQGEGGSVQYLSFLTGSLSEKITSEHFEKGLRVTNWGNAIGPYVAECALMLILCALRQVPKYSFNLKAKGEWRSRLTDNRSLFQKRIGLHGFGAIAQSLVPLLKPFDCKVVADTGVPDSLLKEFGVERAASTEALFRESDVLVELKPLTESTRHSVGEALLTLLPEGACFVNLGRGAVVDEKALIRVGQSRDIQIALDVYETEPLPLESPLRKMENVMLLPHMGGATRDRGLYCGQLAVENIRRFLRNEPLENEVTREQFLRST